MRLGSDSGDLVGAWALLYAAFVVYVVAKV
jgi:hypothetical protein